ncbi:hypothetical protein [Flavisolibacter ginsengisoli]|jgi:hypothetical protein|uniref:Glycosyl transferase family 2 n=1 Tax=Flavisolibacter ginsengisoli DSM 18119 TaxID=1121884 RepID=A0A1M5E1H0_9BACT|nr:hypothetical protein [Flavisolibacter ginsengisoli]SHF73083.1 hypothetical protein SAMN02745131_03386 [Flavisolibacter ginsengisoli DSM 18119]
MKLAAHVLAYNVNRFLKAVIGNLEPHVDKIYIAYPERPFGYNTASRQNLVNPTKLEDILSITDSNKIEILRGDWITEEDMRNDCLQKARFEGFDWFLIQDADEFYTESTWNQIKRILLSNKSDNCFKTTWYNFWKSSQYVLVQPDGSIKNTNASFAIRCNSDIKFLRKRWFGGNIPVLDCPCYHYGYVMSDREMAEKITTWSHANDIFNNNWYKHKWQNWNESTRFLNPIEPTMWSRAIRFPFEQPNFAEEFALPIKNLQSQSFSDMFGDAVYNLDVNLYRVRKSIGKVVKKQVI